MDNIEELISISEFNGNGYLPLVDYGSWRVAVLRYIDQLQPDRINMVECHLETDEVFILFEGRCILFLANVEEGDVVKIHAVDMVPKRLYNVKKGVYHTHTLSVDAHVIIVENQDTGAANSLQIELDQVQVREICELTANLW